MWNTVIVIAAYTALEALRTRILWVLVAVLISAVGVAGFIGSIAITESAEFQTGTLAALLRLACALVVALFVSSSMARELADKGAELFLALPIARATYLVGKLAGYALVAIGCAALAGACTALYAPIDQAALWSASLACELLLVAAASLLCVLTFASVTPAIVAVVGFYVLARSISAIQLMGHEPLIDQTAVSTRFIRGFIDALAYLVPRLDRYTATDWLVYHTGSWNDLGFVTGQSAVYFALLTAAALFDIYRRNF